MQYKLNKYASRVLVIEIKLVYNDYVGRDFWVGITAGGNIGKKLNG
jgi:hypothetical protein